MGLSSTGESDDHDPMAARPHSIHQASDGMRASLESIKLYVPSIESGHESGMRFVKRDYIREPR